MDIFNSSLQQLSNCRDDSFYWLTEKRLKLIADKTKFILIGKHLAYRDNVTELIMFSQYQCLVSMFHL